MNSYQAKLLSLVLGVFFSYFSYAQSISGNVSSLESDATLGYATVDIYKGDDLVASVLTDRSGNFNVKLDTGTYDAVINYAGYKTITKTITVKSDEKADFGLKDDGRSKYKSVEEKEESLDADYDYAPRREMATEMMSTGYSKMGAKSLKPRGSIPIGDPNIRQGEAGKLTAGEINDFSKWDLWTDISMQELLAHQISWKFDVQGRYTVQITDKSDIPLADVVVLLKDKKDKVLYTSRTDNTGKAELWESLAGDVRLEAKDLEIEARYLGKSYTISKPKQAGEGLNKLSLRTECNQSQKVDIAFVVDATGSMSDELHFLTAEMNDVMYQAKQISNALNFRFANVFYRDRGDAYLTRMQDFTRVLSESVAFVSEQRAGGGGDFPEAVDVALDSAINGLNWSEEARTRIVFLILDAPPHNTPEIQQRLQSLSAQAAKQGIRIVPLVASGIDKATEYLMRSIALATNGTYAFLTDHSGIGDSHLEPTTDEYEVELLNELLVRIIKSYTYMPDCEQNIPELDLPFTDSVVQILPSTSDSLGAGIDSTSTAPIDPLGGSWKYYPNPTRDYVKVESTIDIAELYVTDLSGKVLQVIENIKANEVHKIDLSQYASGIYLLRYPIGKQWRSGKVILSRR